MSVLVPCTNCSRHVRAAETACPFCRHALPQDLAKRAVPSLTRRLDRLATFTFAVGLTVAACGGATGGDDGTDDQQTTQQDDEAALKKKKDAGAKEDAGCSEDTQTHDAGGFHALYGMPPIHVDPCASDAGAKKDAGHAKDSGSIHAMYGLPPEEPTDDDAGGFHALYGMPPTP